MATLTDLAQDGGSLTTRLPVSSRDAIGQLAGRFNEFMEKRHGMIKGIAQAAETLSSSSIRLKKIKDCSP